MLKINTKIILLYLRAQFIEGIKNMPYLTSFSLHYDCFDDLIKVICIFYIN